MRLHSVHLPTLSARKGGGVETPTKFQKGGLDRTSVLRGGLLRKRG